MKKYFIILVAAMAMGIGSASAQTVWGARVGLSRPTVSFEGVSLDGKFGLEAGPVLYYSLKNNFYINSGAMFSIKTFEAEDEKSLSMYYVDVPVYAGYSFPIGSLSLYAQAGPFIGFKVSESETTELNSLNYGLGLMAGINLNRFKVELGYQAGLANVSDVDEYDAKLGSLFVGVSYIF